VSDEAATGPGRSSRARKVGLIGALVGVAAAGIAAGVAAERVLVRRTRGGEDPYTDEPFGQLPFDEALTVTTADGIDLHVEIVEPADGVALDFDNDPEPEPTVVFVHGFCLDMGTFHFQRRSLEESHYRMVFYDQPGHGRSGRLEDGEYDLPALGEALRDVIVETCPRGAVVLVGHSMGGMAIMACAERYPELFAERVVGVVLISTSGGRVEGVKLGGLPDLVSRASTPLLPLLSGASRLSGSVIDKARQASTDLAWLLTRRYGFGGKQPSASLVSYVEQMNSSTPTETVARYLRTLSSHARYPALAAIADKPVLIISGDRDPILPLKHSEEIVRHLPDAELVVVADSGHVVLLENSETVNDAIKEFLGRVIP